MKRVISFILMMCMLVSLGICDVSAAEEAAETAESAEGGTIEITPENWEEYFVLAPEYEKKVSGYDIAEIQGTVTLKAAPKLEDAVEVPITLENWNQYFEIAEKRQEQKDAFGNIEVVMIDYCIDVQEEYADKVVPGVDSTVAFQVTADHEMEYVAEGQVDSFSEDGSAAFNPAQMENDDHANLFSQLIGIEQYSPDGALEYTEHPENITMTRVEGSLFLVDVDPEAIAQAAADATPAPDDAPAPESAPVEITMDNWNQYFELTEKQIDQTNAFGEVDSVRLIHAFALKDEYVDKVDTAKENKVAVEVSYEIPDPLLGSISNSEDGEVDFTTDNSAYYGYHYGLMIWNSNGTPGENGDIQWDIVTQNYSVVRVQGQIYLYP